MHRRVFLTCCLAACLAAGVPVSLRHATAQQPQAPGRAKLQNAPAQPTRTPPQTKPPAGAAQAQPPAARQQRPTTELQISKELQDLLVIWERESAKVTKLRGTLIKYTYDSVYGVEKRAEGKFWYEAPDMGRIDFSPAKLPEPPINPEKKAANGAPYTIESERRQRWICTGKEIFIIHDDDKIFDSVEIPVSQQGKNIMNGPLPFLFGMKAEQAKQRYHLSPGSMHWPYGKVVKKEDGTEEKLAPQIHVVALPKLEVDAREWCRAEVLMDGRFLPVAIRLINPSQKIETVYRFRPSDMKWNERLWLDNPFNDRPPASYTRGFDSRATTDETPVSTEK